MKKQNYARHGVLKRMGRTPLSPQPIAEHDTIVTPSHRRSHSLMTPLPPLSPTHNNLQPSQVDNSMTNLPMISPNEKRIIYIGDGADCSANSCNNAAKPPEISCTKIFLYSSFVISAICVFLFVGRDYIKYILLSLERSSVWTSLFVFSILFTVVSFPMTWGYILLNIAVGYLYGVATGVVIVVICALLGIFVAHCVICRFMKDFVWERLANERMRSIIRVIERGSGLKIIVLARLSPIPFGLQNALFAMANITTQRYLVASFLGMLPSQGLHVYIGSTLRSMEEVVSSNSTSTLAYYVFAAQILFAVILFIFTLRKAREEFNKTLDEVKVTDGSECTAEPILLRHKPSFLAAMLSKVEYHSSLTKERRPCVIQL